MRHRLILKVTKFQLPPTKRLGTVVKNILGGHHAPPPPMSNRVKGVQEKPRSKLEKQNFEDFSMSLEQKLYDFVVKFFFIFFS